MRIPPKPSALCQNVLDRWKDFVTWKPKEDEGFPLARLLQPEVQSILNYVDALKDQNSELSGTAMRFKANCDCYRAALAPFAKRWNDFLNANPEADKYEMFENGVMKDERNANEILRLPQEGLSEAEEKLEIAVKALVSISKWQINDGIYTDEAKTARQALKQIQGEGLCC